MNLDALRARVLAEAAKLGHDLTTEGGRAALAKGAREEEARLAREHREEEARADVVLRDPDEILAFVARERAGG